MFVFFYILNEILHCMGMGIIVQFSTKIIKLNAVNILKGSIEYDQNIYLEK